MTNRHLESNVVDADSPRPAILPMAIMAIIMGGAPQTVLETRRA